VGDYTQVFEPWYILDVCTFLKFLSNLMRRLDSELCRAHQFRKLDEIRIRDQLQDKLEMLR